MNTVSDAGQNNKAEVKDNRRRGWFWAYDSIFDLDLPCHAKIAYLALCRHADKDGKSFPGIPRLAFECGMSRSSVERGLVHLRTLNMVVVSSGKNSGETNTYTLTDSADWQGGVRHTDAGGTSHRRTRVRHTDAQRTPHSEGNPFKDFSDAHAQKTASLKPESKGTDVKMAAQFVPHRQSRAEDKDQVVKKEATADSNPCSPPKESISVRVLKETWDREVEAHFQLRAARFTAREYGNLRDMVARYTPETLNALIPWAIRFWRTVQHNGYMYNLPPTPVFLNFYANREQFISAKADYDKRQKQEREEMEKTRAWVEQPVVKPQKSLLEMFEEERKKLREEPRAAA